MFSNNSVPDMSILFQSLSPDSIVEVVLASPDDHVNSKEVQILSDEL